MPHTGGGDDFSGHVDSDCDNISGGGDERGGNSFEQLTGTGGGSGGEDDDYHDFMPSPEVSGEEVGFNVRDPKMSFFSK